MRVKEDAIKNYNRIIGITRIFSDLLYMSIDLYSIGQNLVIWPHLSVREAAHTIGMLGSYVSS